MSRHRSVPLVLLLLTALALGGCGGEEEEPKAEPTSADSEFVEVTPTPTPTAPTATATATGPSGETPAERRERLGGCPAVDDVEDLAGTPVTRAEDPGPTAICRYSSAGRTTYQGLETAEVEISVSEPVGLKGGQDLGAYRREVTRSNPSADASGLGTGAFYSFFEDSPAVCAVWFTAEDGKVLTVSAVDLLEKAAVAGATSPACELAGEVAGIFRG